MYRLITLYKIALLSMFSVVLSGCFDLEYNVEIQSNGSGNLIYAFNADPIMAEGFKNQKLIEHATEVKNYLKNGRFWHEELVGFSNLSNLSLDNERITISGSNYQHTIFPEIKQDRRAELSTAYLLLKGRSFSYRINFPVVVKKAYPVDIDGLQVEPAYNGNTTVWTIPLDLLITIKNPITFRVDLEEAFATGDTQHEEEKDRGVKIDKISAKSKCGDKTSDLRYGIYLKLFEPIIDFDLSLTYQSIKGVEALNEYYNKLITIAEGILLLNSTHSKPPPIKETLDLFGIAFQTVGNGAEVFGTNNYVPIVFDAFGEAFRTIADPKPSSIALYVTTKSFSIVNNLISAIVIKKKTDKFNTIAATREILHAYYEHCGNFDFVQQKLELGVLPADCASDRLSCMTIQYLRKQDHKIQHEYVYETIHRIVLGVMDVQRQLQKQGYIDETGEIEPEDPSQYIGSYSSVSETGDSCEELVIKVEGGNLFALYRSWYCGEGGQPPEFEALNNISIKDGKLKGATANGSEVVWNLKK